MKNRRLYKMVLVTSLFLSSWVSQVSSQTPSSPLQGKSLPIFKLPTPQRMEEKEYLGLSQKDSFSVSEIEAEVLIIEIFSFYCPFCQAIAPEVNTLYQIINQFPPYYQRIKIIGIGAGNTLQEVENFKRTHQIPFPLFPDEDFTIHKRLGEVRTPYFFVAKKRGNRTFQILLAHSGDFGVAEQFFQKILNVTKISIRN